VTPGAVGPVACFSYLAAASLWRVDRFPAAGRGAEVLEMEDSIAADGPMVAAVLAALAQPSVLIANNIGDDLSGRNVGCWLERLGVTTTAVVEADAVTAQIVVVGDGLETRTMFPYLPGVADGLAQADPAPLASATLAYIDCYRFMANPAARALAVARGAGIRVLANLGGDIPSPEILRVLSGYPGLVVQDSIPDPSLDLALAAAARLRAATQAKWAVVTAGAAGAVASGPEGSLSVPGYPVRVRHTHCAGAAFSGGLVYGLVNDWPIFDALRLAAGCGALRCARAHHESCRPWRK
jgi:sugar/nucleoside kinase (ribokinase family)